jgi:hypothetical protein
MAVGGIDMLPIARPLGHRNAKVTEAVHASSTPGYLARPTGLPGFSEQNLAAMQGNLPGHVP